MDDMSLQQQVATHFIADMPTQLASLQVAVNGADVDAIASLAHKIKGAAANMAAEQMREIALELELNTKAGEVAGADEKVQALTEAFVQLTDVLKQALKLS